jgi:hypothetical protein
LRQILFRKLNRELTQSRYIATRGDLGVHRIANFFPIIRIAGREHVIAKLALEFQIQPEWLAIQNLFSLSRLGFGKRLVFNFVSTAWTSTLVTAAFGAGNAAASLAAPAAASAASCCSRWRSIAAFTELFVRRLKPSCCGVLSVDERRSGEKIANAVSKAVFTR